MVFSLLLRKYKLNILEIKQKIKKSEVIYEKISYNKAFLC